MVTELYIAIILGLTLSLIFSELTGVSPGGLIVPGYLALSINNLSGILLIFLMSMIVYLIVNFGISKITIIYGRRRFLAALSVGICVKIIIDILFPTLSLGVNALAGVGVVVPGLLAHTFYKQGIKLTVLSSLGTSVAVFGVIQLASILNFI